MDQNFLPRRCKIFSKVLTSFMTIFSSAKMSLTCGCKSCSWHSLHNWYTSTAVIIGVISTNVFDNSPIFLTACFGAICSNVLHLILPPESLALTTFSTSVNILSNFTLNKKFAPWMDATMVSNVVWIGLDRSAIFAMSRFNWFRDWLNSSIGFALFSTDIATFRFGLFSKQNSFMGRKIGRWDPKSATSLTPAEFFPM